MANFSTKSKKALFDELQKQKRANKQLKLKLDLRRANDNNFKALAENIKDGLVIASSNGKHLFVNNHFIYHGIFC